MIIKKRGGAGFIILFACFNSLTLSEHHLFLWTMSCTVLYTALEEKHLMHRFDCNLTGFRA